MSKLVRTVAVALALGLTAVSFATSADAARRHHRHPGYARDEAITNQARDNAWMDYVSRPSSGL